MVQTVQFLDKVVAMPVLRQVQFLGKVVDTPVVFNDRSYGPDSADPDKFVALPVVFLRQLHMGPDVQKTCGRAADAVLRGLDVSVTMQRLCGVDGDGVRGFFAVFLRLFSVEALSQ